MAGMKDAPRVTVSSAAQLRAWLVENHASSSGVWLVRPRPGPDRDAPSYDELIEELLAFGWIDGQYAPIDADTSMLWITHRKPRSGWSRLSKERVARVQAAGRMTPAGAAVIEAAQADGSWALLDDVEALVVPPDLEAALAARPGAREHWDGFGPGARKVVLTWIVTARRPDTRAARVEEAARSAEQGVPARR
ncbi:YdeI/OmpD-associated family protein [Cellulomonas sp. SG140]|uniref:YdeI/OmpD-associated family protein n=1 Tax=Cellulomonas sp. SG140 TaxID=2976536 RepID=UPI0021E8FDB9|nr:YdeI/OmpD-associated family protein [Cellulomonas sp. SG140]